MFLKSWSLSQILTCTQMQMVAETLTGKLLIQAAVEPLDTFEKVKAKIHNQTSSMHMIIVLHIRQELEYNVISLKN